MMRQEPGDTVAAWNFMIAPETAATSHVRTKTRVRCTDAESHRRVARYWRVVRPFSGWIRMEILRALRRNAEHPSAANR